MACSVHPVYYVMLLEKKKQNKPINQLQVDCILDTINALCSQLLRVHDSLLITLVLSKFFVLPLFVFVSVLFAARRRVCWSVTCHVSCGARAHCCRDVRVGAPAVTFTACSRSLDGATASCYVSPGVSRGYARGGWVRLLFIALVLTTMAALECSDDCSWLTHRKTAREIRNQSY